MAITAHKMAARDGVRVRSQQNYYVKYECLLISSRVRLFLFCVSATFDVRKSHTGLNSSRRPRVFVYLLAHTALIHLLLLLNPDVTFDPRLDDLAANFLPEEDQRVFTCTLVAFSVLKSTKHGDSETKQIHERLLLLIVLTLNFDSGHGI